MSLTDRTVAALRSPDRGQKIYPDHSIPGFGVRVSQGGSKTFVLTVGAERRKITIGRYPVVSLAQAREAAKTFLAQRQLGLLKPLTPFFGQVLEEYCAARDETMRTETLRKDRYRFTQLQPLSGKRIGDIAPKDVQEILDALPAPSSRVEVYTRFSGLIRFAQKKGYMEQWPLHRLDCRVRRGVRERVLTDRELASVLSTARLWRLGGHYFGDIVELLVLTGQRRQQIGRLDRSHVDFDANTITWPPELMKAGRKHIIPLGVMVRAVLEPRRVNGLYFPNKYGEPFSFASAHVRQFQRDCAFDDWVLHDLRRTLATYWQDMGIEIATTEKMLSHSAITGGLVGVYQRSTYLSQMREAVRKWEARVARLSEVL